MKEGTITIRLKEDDIPFNTKGYGKATTRLIEAGADRYSGDISFSFDYYTNELIAYWHP